MEKKVIKLNENSLTRIIKSTAQRIMEELDSYPEIEGDEFDPENPTAKRYQTDMAWHDLESGALDDPERGLYRKAEQNSEKMHYMKPVGDNPDSWDNVALDEPTNVRDDKGRISMMAQDDSNPFWQTVARNKQDTLRKSRGENFENRNRRVNKAINEAVKKVLREDVELISYINNLEEGDYGKGTKLYEFLNGLSDYVLSVFCMNAEDKGYKVLYDMIGDYYTVRKMKQK